MTLVRFVSPEVPAAALNPAAQASAGHRGLLSMPAPDSTRGPAQFRPVVDPRRLYDHTSAPHRQRSLCRGLDAILAIHPHPAPWIFDTVNPFELSR